MLKLNNLCILLSINGYSHFAFKLDLNKDFDKIEWNFLESVLYGMHFPPCLISLITRCIRLVRLSVINCAPYACFFPTRGIIWVILFSCICSLFLLRVSFLWFGILRDKGVFSSLCFNTDCPSISHILLQMTVSFFEKQMFNKMRLLKMSFWTMLLYHVHKSIFKIHYFLW